MSLVRLSKKRTDAPDADSGTYYVTNRHCLGNKCFAPGDYQVRGATLSGSRNTGRTSKCCLTNAYRGCPNEEDREFSEERLKERRHEGWKNV